MVCMRSNFRDHFLQWGNGFLPLRGGLVVDRTRLWCGVTDNSWSGLSSVSGLGESPRLRSGWVAVSRLRIWASRPVLC